MKNKPIRIFFVKMTKIDDNGALTEQRANRVFAEDSPKGMMEKLQKYTNDKYYIDSIEQVAVFNEE